jgi:hypothetical protein
MFKVGKIFHLTHVVKDLAAVDRWYDKFLPSTDSITVSKNWPRAMLRWSSSVTS